MQSSITLIFPHQLFASHPSVDTTRLVYLVECDLFFTHYKFHKQKLVLHRASMKHYQQRLIDSGYAVEYIEAQDTRASISELFAYLAKAGTDTIYYANSIDYLLERRINRSARQQQIRLVRSESPNFICTSAYNQEYFESKKYFLTDYYIAQRKRFNILLEGDKPTGGRWTYDTDNRKKMPANTYIPSTPSIAADQYVTNAQNYVSEKFANHFGTVSAFHYPTTHAAAEAWLETFLAERLSHYGEYQDAMVQGQSWLFHAILTPMLNIGLLSPAQVIDRAVAVTEQQATPLNSLEGFIRQVLGWREYIRAVYEAQGVAARNTNHWGHTRPIPASFYTGDTGIAPVDDVIKRLLSTGYSHHIERLMVLGNFMLLCEIDPDQVYQWFMELYIDSYDWVMVPNVYGMSQYADGGLMSTKPYISGSAYLLKMSNYPKGPWCEVWDALYWRFIYKHREQFARNPRMSMMAAMVGKMESEKLKNHLQVAEDFLKSISE